MKDINLLDIGDTFVEDLGNYRLTYKVVGRDDQGRIISELISQVAICKDTTIETMIEEIKAVPETKSEPKKEVKPVAKKAPAKKPTKKK